MTLRTPPPPPEILDALRRDLRRLANNPNSLVPPTNVSVARGLALYLLPEGQTPSDERPIGWRFVVLGEGGAFWVDMKGDLPAAIYRGPAVDDLLRAGDLLEAADLDGEVAVLSLPLVAGGALWVRDRAGSCVQFSPSLSETLQDRETLVEEWRARATDLARHSAELIE